MGGEELALAIESLPIRISGPKGEIESCDTVYMRSPRRTDFT